MSRRPSTVLLQMAVLLFGTLLAVATNIVPPIGGTDPSYVDAVNRWSLPIICGIVVLLGVFQWILYRLERTTPTPPWSPGRSPFPGLEAFGEDDAGVFFGRSSDIDVLYERLNPAVPTRASRFITVTGPSGVGKSSLVRAGLLPRLAHRGRWVVLPVMTSQQPMASLVGSLSAALKSQSRRAISRRLAEPSGLSDLIDDVRSAERGRAARVLLVVDQAEQILAGPDEAPGLAFLATLESAVLADERFWVLFVLRSEFLTPLLATPYAHLFSRSVNVGALGRDALFDVIRGPAERDGVTFEPPGLVNTMVDETAGGDALPLLAYTLRELYLAAGRTRRITAESYRNLGGVTGTLRRQADKVAAELMNDDPQAPVLDTLLKFVTATDVGTTRRPVSRNALSEAERHVVDGFVTARLLNSDHNGEDTVYQVVHEALFRLWEPLRLTIEVWTEALQWRADVERWAAEWERSGRHDTFLLRGSRLESAYRWSTTDGWREDGGASVTELLERSRRADQAALLRLADACSERAYAYLDRDPEFSLLLACTAVEECVETPQGRSVLASALAVARVRGVFRGHTDEIWCVAAASDGRRIATGSQDCTARIVDVLGTTPDVVLRGHDGWVRKVAWSPDDRWIATASEDNTARTWHAADGIPHLTLRGHADWVRSVAWSSDGTRLATASNDMTARIWNAHTGEHQLALEEHGAPVWDIAWSPDRRVLATASQDRTVRLWDALDGSPGPVLRGHDDWVRVVTWSPDGTMLATASNDRTARIWRASDGAELRVLRGHEDWVRSVSWSLDGRRLATASNDRTARIWGVNTGQTTLVLKGHSDTVSSVAWLPDRRIVSCSRDRTVRLWDTRHRVEHRVLRGHTDSVGSVAWSKDNRLLASASHDGTARVWDVVNKVAPLVFQGHAGVVRSVDWSPDGLRLATSSSDHTARLWSAQDATLLSELRGHTDAVGRVAWSPDGTLVATASQDRTVRLWDAAVGDGVVGPHAHHDDAIWSVAWSPDGRRLATTSSDRTARVWSVAGMEPIAELRGHEDTVWDAAWSPDGRRLATVSHDRTIRIWPMHADAEPVVLSGHGDTVWSVAWSSDGRRLATVSQDRTVRIWDVTNGSELLVLGVHTGQAEGVAWSPNGQYVATSARDRTIRIWNAVVDLPAQLEMARRFVFRKLTADERHDLGLPPIVTEHPALVGSR